MLTPDEALARTLSLVEALDPETAFIDEALGRALADDILSQKTLPPWDNSAMDGFAVRVEDLVQVPCTLRVLETIVAGSHPSQPLQAGTCSRIMTGAPVPPGTTAVVPVEHTRSSCPAQVDILERPLPEAFIRPRGEDTVAGQQLMPRGTTLGIPEAAQLWAQGFQSVRVCRRPRVAILSTGDELCDVSTANDHQLVDTNGPALALAVRQAGGIPQRLGIARDTVEDVLRLLGDVTRFDGVVSSAGVSLGERDVVRTAFEQLGVEQSFWRVAIKPGKPLAVGKLGKTVFWGLPGNPASSLVSFELFVRPALRKMMGHAQTRPMPVFGRTSVPLSKPPGLTHFLRATVDIREGELWATPLTTQTSGVRRSVLGATHLLVFRSESTELAPGAPVTLMPTLWHT